MMRSRPRTSRALIGLLIVTIIVGAISFINKVNDSKAEPAVPGSATPASPAVAAAPAKPASPTDELSGPSVHVTVAPQQVDTQNPAAQKIEVSSTPAPAPAAANKAQAPVTPVAAKTGGKSAAPALSGNPLADAKGLLDQGDLLASRNLLNEALIAGKFNAADARTAKQMMASLNDQIVFGSRRFADDSFGGTYSVQRGDVLAKIARNHDVTTELLMRLNGITDPRKLQAGQTLKVIQGPIHATVSKSDFIMDLYFGKPNEAGSMYITSYRVGLGADDSTPTGVWLVEPQKKLKNPVYYSPRGEGIIEADDPANPLGEFWIGLTGIDGHAVGKLSYGVHGTIEPDSIGKMASMGCIRLLNEDVARVYEMLVEGKSTVTVTE